MSYLFGMKGLPGYAMSNHLAHIPLGPPKLGTTKPVYRMTSPFIISKRGVSQRVDRLSRMWQIYNTENRRMDCDEVPFPSSHMPVDEDAKDFKFYLGIEIEDKKANKRSKDYKEKIRNHEARLFHERENTVYLSPYEYEHRLLDSIGARRGLTPRRANSSFRCHHHPWEE